MLRRKSVVVYFESGIFIKKIMTIQSIERESGKVANISSGRTIYLEERVSFGKEKLYSYLSGPVSLESLPKGQGYLVNFGKESSLNFCVWPSRDEYVQTEITIFKAT